jgi:DNA-binding MarR family transcriptional regulator
MRVLVALGQLLRVVDEAVRKELRETGLSPVDLEALAWLYDRPGVTGASISEKTGRTRQNIQRTLESLERRDLVMRYDSVVNHRTVGWGLTDRGREAAERAVRRLQWLEQGFHNHLYLDVARLMQGIGFACEVARGGPYMKRCSDDELIRDVPPETETNEWDL